MNPDTIFSRVRILATGVDILGDLLVRDGLIADFGQSLGHPDGATVIEADGAVTLGNDALARAFDAQRLLAHRGRFIDALVWRS